MAYRGLPQPRGAKPMNEGDPNNFLSKAHPRLKPTPRGKSGQVVFDSLRGFLGTISSPKPSKCAFQGTASLVSSVGALFSPFRKPRTGG